MRGGTCSPPVSRPRGRLFHARQHRHRHIRYIQHWRQAVVVRIDSAVAKTVLCLITTWLRVALLHSPASASTALPGFFVRGRLGGMRFRTLQIAWSVACFLALALLLPDADASRGPTGQLIAPSPWFMPILIGFPVLAVASWLPLRFSLRTLLIATTLVAALLGLILYTAR